MPFKTNGPGGCCCDPCTRFAADFSTLASFNANFTILDGEPEDFTVSDFVLRLSVNGDEAIANTTIPFEPYAMRVVTRLSGGTGSVLRVLLAHDGTDQNALIVEYVPGVACGELRVLSRVAGVETELEAGLSAPDGVPDAWGMLQVCYDPDRQVVTLVWINQDGEYTTHMLDVPALPYGSQAGLAVADIGTDEDAVAQFSSFELRYIWFWPEAEGRPYTSDDVTPGSCGALLITYGGVDEAYTWSVQMTGRPTAGTFTLTYRGITTPAISYSVTAAELEAILYATWGGTTFSPNVIVRVNGSGPLGEESPWHVHFWDVDYHGLSGSASFADCLTGGDTYVADDRVRTWCPPCTATFCYWAVSHFDTEDRLYCEWDTVIGETWTINTTAEQLETTDTGILLAKQTYPWKSLSPDMSGSVSAYRDAFADSMYYRVSWQVDTAGKELLAIVCAAVDPDTGARSFLGVRIAVGLGTEADCADLVFVRVVEDLETAISPVHRITDCPLNVWRTLVLSYEAGLLKACVTNASQTWQTAAVAVQGVDGNSTGVATEPDNVHAPWQREWRPSTAIETRYGERVGVGAASTGTLKIRLTEGHCYPIREHCELEADSFVHASDVWHKCQWNLISGTWPHRMTFTANAMLLHLNPVCGCYQDKHSVKANLSCPEDSVVTGVEIGIVFGADATGSNGFAAVFRRSVSSWVLELRKITSGVHSVLASTASVAPEQLTACVLAGTVGCSASVGLTRTGTASGPYWGLWAKTPGGPLYCGEITSYRHEHVLNAWHNPFSGECTQCDDFVLAGCRCTDGEAPLALVVDITGMAGAVGTCLCDFLNQAFTALYYSNQQNVCRYRFDLALTEETFGRCVIYTLFGDRLVDAMVLNVIPVVRGSDIGYGLSYAIEPVPGLTPIANHLYMVVSVQIQNTAFSNRVRWYFVHDFGVEPASGELSCLEFSAIQCDFSGRDGSPPLNALCLEQGTVYVSTP